MAGPEAANPAADEPLDPQRVGRPEPRAPAIRIHLLGGFRVVIDSDVVDDAAWRLRKAKGLVKLLALTPGHSLQRDELMERLWPQLAPDAAANNLRYAVHVARRALQGASGASLQWLPTRHEQIALFPSGPVWTDVETFEQAATVARQAADLAACDAAIDLYAGELLPEDRYEDWAAGRREALLATYLALLIDVAQLREARGEHSRAIAALERLVAIEPIHEQAQVTLMRLRALAGERGRALHHYRRFASALRQELDTEPDPTSERLYQDILAGRYPVSGTPGAETLPTSVASTPRTNLPVSVTTFIGREREIAEIQRLLGDVSGGGSRVRLLTLVGAGGCGKTRLALSVAADLVRMYPDGVWLVELAGLSDPKLAPAAVAAALRVRGGTGRSITATLIDALQSRRMLLILDNCEHLISDVAELAATLLSACPGVQMLATSRESLRVAGELIWRVPSLAMPDPRRSLPSEALRGVEAVSLFLDRVQLRQPDFILTPDNAPAVIEICRRLDGLPLAIELAAARVPALSAGEIAAHLNDALSFLTSGNRTDLPRQQTLRATLDWSYALLTSIEQTTLNRLSIFAGGWTLEAAESVVSGDGIGKHDVLDSLAWLVEKSLVQVDRDDGTTRYRLLETVRQYALERLVDTGAEFTVAERHADIFLALAMRANDGLLSGVVQDIWLDRLDLENHNLRAALDWSLAHGGGETGAWLASALWFFWELRGHWDEGRTWLDRALAIAVDAPPGARAGLLRGAGTLAIRQGDYQVAARYLEECLTLSIEQDDSFATALTLFFLGNLAVERDTADHPLAAQRYADALDLFQSLDQRYWSARTLNNLGNLRYFQNDVDGAVHAYEAALALFRELGSAWGTASSLGNLGGSLTVRGSYVEAAALLREGIDLSSRHGYKHLLATNLYGMGMLAAATRQHESATHLFAAAATMRTSLGMVMPSGDRVEHDRVVGVIRVRLGEEAFRAAWDAGQRMSVDDAVADVLRDSVVDPSGQPDTVTGPARRVPLSRREHEVAVLIARGLTNHQIAGELKLAQRTVDTHVSHILHKLGLASRAHVLQRVGDRAQES